MQRRGSDVGERRRDTEVDFVETASCARVKDHRSGVRAADAQRGDQHRGQTLGAIRVAPRLGDRIGKDIVDREGAVEAHRRVGWRQRLRTPDELVRESALRRDAPPPAVHPPHRRGVRAVHQLHREVDDRIGQLRAVERAEQPARRRRQQREPLLELCVAFQRIVGFALLALRRLRREPLLRDVPLRSPRAEQAVPFHDSGQIVQEELRPAVAIALVRLDIDEAISRFDEPGEVLDVLGILGGHQLRQPGANDFLRRRKPVHPRHRLVALGQPGAFEHAPDLLVDRQRCVQRRIDLETPDSLGAVPHEGAISLLAREEGCDVERLLVPGI